MSSPEVIFASYDPTYPDRNGGTHARSQVISFLQERGFNLYLAQGDRSDAAAYPGSLRRLFHQPPGMRTMASIALAKHAYFNFWLFFAVLRSKGPKTTVIQAGWSSVPAAYLLKRLRHYGWIAMLVDPATAVDTSGRDMSRSRALSVALSKVVEGLSRRADFVTAVNKDEASTLLKYGFSPEKTECVPITTHVLDAPGALASPEFRTRFLADNGLPKGAALVAFHGHLVTSPNRRAVEEILTRIAPKTYEIDRSVVFLVVGEGEKPRRVEPNVVFLGYVEDLNRLLSNVDVVITPLDSGAGMKNKILDGLNCAVPVVSTAKALSGFEPEGCPVTVSALEDFPAAVVRLVKSPDRRQRGISGWEYLKRNYSPERLIEYERMVRATLEGKV